MGTFDSGKMSQPAKKTVELFYDVISPYTWIAFEMLSRYKPVWDLDVKLTPCLTAGVFKEAGNRSGLMVPAKGANLRKDMSMAAKHFQVPLVFPDPDVLMKVGSIHAMRFMTALGEVKPDFTEPMARELWMRVWSRGQDITQSSSFQAAAEACGLPETETEKCLEAMKTKEIKQKLIQGTQQAVEQGAFGMPTMITKDEDGKSQMLFGSDRFHILADILGKEYQGP